MEKESLLEIARELKLTNILERDMSPSEMILEIVRKKQSDIDWSEMKYRSGQQSFSRFFKDQNDTYQASLMGDVKVVDQYGGEGMGDDYWMVVYFEKFDTYIRLDGWYASYDGGTLDGDPYIVEPRQKTITVYEAK